MIEGQWELAHAFVSPAVVPLSGSHQSLVSISFSQTPSLLGPAYSFVTSDCKCSSLLGDSTVRRRLPDSTVIIRLHMREEMASTITPIMTSHAVGLPLRKMEGLPT